MHVDPPNSIRNLHTGVSSPGDKPKRDTRSKQNFKPSSEPGNVELQLSEEAANVPKHQQSKDGEQDPTRNAARLSQPSRTTMSQMKTALT